MTEVRPLIIDHRDSFTYNLAELVRKITGKFPVVIDFQQLHSYEMDGHTHIFLSPGPGLPEEFSTIPFLLKKYAGRTKILGVCLGHQAIAEFFGGKLKQLDFPVHGQALKIRRTAESALWEGLPSEFRAGFYHSWTVDELPADLSVIAVDEANRLAAFEHRNGKIFGVQFHPESFLTPLGEKIIQNFLR